MQNEQTDFNEGTDSQSSLFEDIPFTDLVIPSNAISHQGGYCYSYSFQSHAGKFFTRVIDENSIAVSENQVPLQTGSSPHETIRLEGAGRISLWKGHIYFSALDNSDPRTNGKTYTVKVPNFVHFVEKLPASGIKKFAV